MSDGVAEGRVFNLEPEEALMVASRSGIAGDSRNGSSISLSSPSSSTSSSSTPSAENQQQLAKEYRYALDCYERALLWAGANAKSLSNGTGENSGPVDEVLAAEWQALWSGYNRTREAILKQATTATSENIEKK